MPKKIRYYLPRHYIITITIRIKLNQVDEKNKSTSKKMRNRNFHKKSVKKMPLESLKALFIFMFSFCESWERQNIKGIFFSPTDLLKSFCVDGIIFLHNFFLYFPISTKPKVKKILYTFCSTSSNLKVKKKVFTFVSTSRNLEVKKNPSNLCFQIVPLQALNALFSTLKTGKLRFSSLFDSGLNYFVI